MSGSSTSAGKPTGLRVVLDTNVYFSAFTHPRSELARIWQHAVDRQYTLLVSPAIIGELAGVFRTDYLTWSESTILGQLRSIVRLAEIVTPDIVLDVITDDPDDNRILECAVAGRANLIVSGDRHLTRLKSLQGIGIVRPADFLRILSS